MATRAILTYADYAALPADGRRSEVHRGELSVTPAPGPRHQETALNLATLLQAHVKANGLGKILTAPIDCILSDTTIVQPDILHIARERLAIVSERGIEGAPTLVVEILSPSTAGMDRGRKRDLYAQHRVPCYWIVDPDARVIDVLVLVEARYQVAGHLVGGQPTTLYPFSGLVIDPVSVWP